MKVRNSVAFVTGANRGLGLAFTRALLAGGARKVYGGARDPDSITLPGIVPVRLDVADAASIEAAAAACGDVDLLINNAGIARGRSFLGAGAIEAARAELETNYFGPLLTSRAFAPILARSGGGAIVNVLSSGGLVAVPAMGGYSPSKFAGRAAAACIRAELAGQGTKVSALIVGSVDTRMAAHVAGHKEAPADIAKAGLTAIKRGIDEMDTDLMALEVRASLARDPKALERGMARMLDAEVISTGR